MGPGQGCARAQPLWPEHAAFMDDLFARGVIALGGPFLDGSGAMLVMRVARRGDCARTAHPGPLVHQTAATYRASANPPLDDLPRRALSGRRPVDDAERGRPGPRAPSDRIAGSRRSLPRRGRDLAAEGVTVSWPSAARRR